MINRPIYLIAEECAIPVSVGEAQKAIVFLQIEPVL
jgi:hypothetical protein